MKRIALALGLAFLVDCKDKLSESNPKRLTPSAISTADVDKSLDAWEEKYHCNFQTAKELENFVQQEIQKKIPEVITFYNKQFGLNNNPDSVKIAYGNITEGKEPSFHYDFDKRTLRLELTPKDNADKYVQDMCAGKGYIWPSYQGRTIGFTPHEVAHWVHDKFMKDNDIKLDKSIACMNQIGSCAVIEGTAVYMASFIDPDESHRDVIWDGVRAYEDPYTNLLATKLWGKWGYPAGEKLVRPILDKDFKRGLRIMSANHPKIKEAKDFVTYQKKVLKLLD